jgi:TatD DNase family protein
MELIDTHAHLDPASFIDFKNEFTVDEIIKNAENNFVKKIITVSSSVESIEKNIEITNNNKNIFCSLGVHPHDAKDYTEEIETNIINHKKNEKNKVIAIGEIGLDYYYEHTDRIQQKKIFIQQINLAKTLKLPLILHIRDAHQDAYDILKQELPNGNKGVIHCYSGSKEFITKYLDLGFYISFTGIITFPKATSVHENAIFTPINKILLETDCPFLTPIPYRGKTNYPEYLIYIAKKLAELKNISLEEIATATTKNAITCFELI